MKKMCDKYYEILFIVKTLKPVFKFIEHIKLLVNTLDDKENFQNLEIINQFNKDDIKKTILLESKLIESGFCDQASFCILPDTEHENLYFVRAVVKASNEDDAKIMFFVYYHSICIKTYIKNGFFITYINH